MPPIWVEAQTKAIQTLKQIIPTLPHLSILFTSTCILQTDASANFWSVILLEELAKKMSIYGYKSRQFSLTKVNYHSTYKEILDVKRGIKKFEFHLAGYHFVVEIDMTDFPSMIIPKKTRLPTLS